MEISIDETDEKLSRLEMTSQERLELVQSDGRDWNTDPHHVPERAQEIPPRKQ